MELVDLGILLIILGMLFIAMGSLFSLGGRQAKEGVHAGAVIFVGPVPLVFATDRDTAMFALLVALTLLAAVVLWLRI